MGGIDPEDAAFSANRIPSISTGINEESEAAAWPLGSCLWASNSKRLPT
jgi:hypothetical protein